MKMMRRYKYSDNGSESVWRWQRRYWFRIIEKMEHVTRIISKIPNCIIILIPHRQNRNKCYSGFYIRIDVVNRKFHKNISHGTTRIRSVYSNTNIHRFQLCVIIYQRGTVRMMKLPAINCVSRNVKIFGFFIYTSN